MLQQHVPEGSGKNSPCWVKGLCHGNDMCKALWGHFAKGSFLHRESVDEEELLRLQLTAEQQRSTDWLTDWLSVMCQPGRWTISSKACCLCLTEREREGTLLQHQGQILSTEPSDTTNVICDITVWGGCEGSKRCVKFGRHFVTVIFICTVRASISIWRSMLWTVCCCLLLM